MRTGTGELERLIKKEQTLLKQLKENAKKRERFCVDFHQMLWDDGIHFPNFLAPALEHLIIDFDTENPKKRGALVSGKFKIGTRHSVFKGERRQDLPTEVDSSLRK